jgi:uncharacterized protein YndB with AHSA1/START domain
VTRAMDVVAAEVEVPVDPATAFALYVTRPGRRHPKDGLSGAPAEIIYEPLAGGRWYERADDGREYEWGKVIEWDPPHRLILAWMVGASTGEWAFDPDPTHASRAEITFQSTEHGTRVRVEHSGFEAHGSGAASIKRGASRGWVEDLHDLTRAADRQDRSRSAREE